MRELIQRRWAKYYRKEIIIGHGETTPYLTRYILGKFRFHIFHRGDIDPDPHDHPFDFKTFPFTSYVEAVYNTTTGATYITVVRAFRWHSRKAEHCHRVLGRWNGQDEYSGHDGPQIAEGKPIYTLVITGPRTRDWGFWRKRVWIPWKRYVSGNFKTWTD